MDLNLAYYSIGRRKSVTSEHRGFDRRPLDLCHSAQNILKGHFVAYCVTSEYNYLNESFPAVHFLVSEFAFWNHLA